MVVVAAVMNAVAVVVRAFAAAAIAAETAAAVVAVVAVAWQGIGYQLFADRPVPLSSL
jgi:hypothetical protein